MHNQLVWKNVWSNKRVESCGVCDDQLTIETAARREVFEIAADEQVMGCELDLLATFIVKWLGWSGRLVTDQPNLSN